MYYLLENGKIVDRLSIREDLDLPFEVDFYVQKDEIVLTVDHIHFEHISIIKKVENVFDLIEIGDLIKYQFINGYYELVSTVELVTEINIVFKQKEYIGVLGKDIEKNKDILAIYKPNEKGDYIKVWEKKENE